MKNKKIVIAGGTGFIGQALAAWFGKDNAITILTRETVSRAGAINKSGGHNTNNNHNHKLLTPADGYNIVYRHWDGLRVDPSWAKSIDGADIVINLAGKSVNCRYTRANRQAIFDSRTDSTRAIGLAIRDAVEPPKIWINGSSATIYRDARDRPQDEFTGEFHDDFSVLVCQAWEKTFEEQRAPFTRKIALRTAITLGSGGVMIPYLNLLKLGLGGHQGDGDQRYSWVHIDDVCRVIEWIESNPSAEGVYNLAAPQPVTNRVFMATLRQATGHVIGLPATTWMLKIGARLIGTETELLLKSRWVVPTRLQKEGFSFRHPDLPSAVQQIIASIPPEKYHIFPAARKKQPTKTSIESPIDSRIKSAKS